MPTLFVGTIKDNISGGDLMASDQDVEEAARMANIHDFVAALPDQYEVIQAFIVVAVIVVAVTVVARLLLTTIFLNLGKDRVYWGLLDFYNRKKKVEGACCVSFPLILILSLLLLFFFLLLLFLLPSFPFSSYPSLLSSDDGR